MELEKEQFIYQDYHKARRDVRRVKCLGCGSRWMVNNRRHKLFSEVTFTGDWRWPDLLKVMWFVNAKNEYVAFRSKCCKKPTVPTRIEVGAVVEGYIE